MNKFLEIAKQASKESEKYLIDIINNNNIIININSSIGRDIKLEADKESENVIVKYLEMHSDIPILSEEMNPTGNYKETEFIWIVDPLDGSLNFSRGINNFCISIGLWNYGKPLLGTINDFIHHSLYEGIVGKFALCNNKKIKVSNVEGKSNSILATGFPVDANFSKESLESFINDIQNYKKIRLLGSAALSLSYLASGKVDAFHENEIMITMWPQA